MDALKRCGRLLACACLAAIGCTRGNPTPDAVLMVTIDTLRADRTSAYGYGRQTTPFLASLAADGVRFASAYTTMPTTDPAHVSMLTGLYPAAHGVRRNGQVIDDQRTPTLAHWLTERGYRSAAVTARAHLNPRELRMHGFESVDAPTPPKVTRNAGEVLARARRELEAFGGARWFLWVHLWEPHAPYDPPDEFTRAFYRGPRLRDGKVPGRYREPPTYEGPHPFRDEEVAAVSDLYDGEVAAADAALARLVSLAREYVPDAGSLLVAVTSDHGETLGEHRTGTGIAFGHGTMLHEEIVRVPWVLWWPAGLSPLLVRTPVSLIDFAATLSALIDPSSPLLGQGRSHTAALRAGRQPDPAPIFIERRAYRAEPQPGLGHKQWAYLEWPWKLVRVRAGSEVSRYLFHLDQDPLERSNRLNAEPQLASRLTQALESLIGDSDPGGGADGGRGLTDPKKRENLRSLGYVD